MSTPLSMKTLQAILADHAIWLHAPVRIAFALMCLCPALTSPVAYAFPRPYTPLDAAWHITSPASVLQGQRHAQYPHIRCTAGQRVGIWIDSAEAVTLDGVTVTGCEVGILVGRTPPAPARPPGDARHIFVRSTHAIQGVTIQGTAAQEALVGIWWGGDGGTITGCGSACAISHVRYGLLLAGDGVWVEGLQIFSPSQDGIVVLGDVNTVVRNMVDGAGQHGLNIVDQVPFAAPGVILTPLREVPTGNIIQENTLTNSGGYDLRQWPARCSWEYHPTTFVGNIAARKSAWCLIERPPVAD